MQKCGHADRAGLYAADECHACVCAERDQLRAKVARLTSIVEGRKSQDFLLTDLTRESNELLKKVEVAELQVRDIRQWVLDKISDLRGAAKSTAQDNLKGAWLNQAVILDSLLTFMAEKGMESMGFTPVESDKTNDSRKEEEIPDQEKCGAFVRTGHWGCGQRRGHLPPCDIR